MAAYTVILLYVWACFFLVHHGVHGQETIQLVPAIYIFGDSTVDGGNRLADANVYGKDLNTTAPTRWTNGKTIADFIAIFLGLPLVPPYNDMYKAGISKTGVNYAYAGCGLLQQTGPEGWTFESQVDKFNSTVNDNLTKIYNQQDLKEHLKDSIFLFSFGINDFNRLYLPLNNGTLNQLAPATFAQLLLNQLSVGLMQLYGMGARKFLINNIWPLGCAPGNVNQSNPMAICCNQTTNDVVLPYSNKLPTMLKELQNNLSGAVFSHSDNFQFVEDLKENPIKYGITNTTGECYHMPSPSDTTCKNRDEYLYFDYIHTTQAANRVFSLNCFNGTLCSPLNIIHLVGAQVS